jgi:hypothetical protein
MTPAQLEDLIRESLQEIVNLPVEPVIPDNKVIATNPGSKLIFPITRDGETRISEQEARFLFVHKLEQDNNAQCLYSVEAPTKKLYRFSGDGAPTIDDQRGESGNIDVCLHDKNGEREYLIEFKALNPEQMSYSKDFLKLICDEDNAQLTNYFVHVIKNSNKRTIPSIEDKYNLAIENAQKQAQAQPHPLKQSKLVIFLCDMGKKEITKYIWNNGNWNNGGITPIPPKN